MKTRVFKNREQFIQNCKNENMKIALKRAATKRFTIPQLEQVVACEDVTKAMKKIDEIELDITKKIEEIVNGCSNRDVLGELCSALYFNKVNISILQLIANAKSKTDANNIRRGFEFSNIETEESLYGEGYPLFYEEYCDYGRLALPTDVKIELCDYSEHLCLKYGEYKSLGLGQERLLKVKEKQCALKRHFKR